MEQPRSTPPSRGARFSPDRPFVGYGVTVLVLLVMLAAMAFSFIALYESAEWTHNPREFWWLAPVIIDGPILVYTASYAIWRWRGIEKFAHHAMRVLIFFTGLSVSVNSLHVAAGWQWAWDRPELYGGVAMAAVAPIGALLAAHEVTRLVFMNHEEGDTFAQADIADALGAVETHDRIEEVERTANNALAKTVTLEETVAKVAYEPMVQHGPHLEPARTVMRTPEADSESDSEPAPRPTFSQLLGQEVNA